MKTRTSAQHLAAILTVWMTLALTPATGGNLRSVFNPNDYQVAVGGSPHSGGLTVSSGSITVNTDALTLTANGVTYEGTAGNSEIYGGNQVEMAVFSFTGDTRGNGGNAAQTTVYNGVGIGGGGLADVEGTAAGAGGGGGCGGSGSVGTASAAGPGGGSYGTNTLHLLLGGSGGGGGQGVYAWAAGGGGGGAIALVALGHLDIANSTIEARGGNGGLHTDDGNYNKGGYGGGGSGGGILLAGLTVDLTDANVRANGGNGGRYDNSYQGGVGGGGRIALYVGGIAGNVSDWNAVDCDAVDGNGALDDPVPSVRGLMLTGATITATKGATGAGAAGHGSIHAVYYVPPAGTVIVIR